MDENFETIETDQGEITITETETPVVIVETKTAATESGATISQLVDTIAGLTDSIQALRLQVESERNSNFEMIAERLNSIEEKIVPRETNSESESAVEEISETLQHASNKPVKRWL